MPRKAAWEVLQVVSAGAYSDVALDRVLKKYKFTDIDRSLTTELAYGAIRLRKFLDCWIDFLGKIPSRKQPPLLRLLLHLGLYQILKMDKIPSSAAINTSVELAKRSKISNLAPVVNGLLRTADRFICSGKILPLPASPSACLVQEHSLPLWLAEDLISWFGEKRAEEVAKAFNKVPSFDLRVNRLCATPSGLQKEFEKVGIKSRCIENSPDCLQVDSGLAALNQWPGYQEGRWCIQDRSSQRVSLLLDPQPGDNVLDACSAPGSKTTHLAELMDNTGKIWAVDRSLSRLNLVAANSKRMRASSINILEADSLQIFCKSNLNGSIIFNVFC